MSLVRDFWRGLERRGLSLTDAEAWKKAGLLTPTAAGVSVTPENAMRYTAVFGCVRILAESVAQLPLVVYQRRAGGQGRDRADNFYLSDVLRLQPNPLMTSFEFRETLMGHLALRGNAYVEIEYDNSGRIVALWPLNPNRMLAVEQTDEGGLIYTYQLPSGRPVRFREWQLWHLRGIGSDGILGYSPIALARQAVGLGLAAEEFGARFFGNNATPGGVLQHPGTLKQTAFDNLKKDWEEMHKGLKNSHRVAILEEGMTYQQIGIAPEDAQFLETRKFQITEIARIFRVPPHMLADLDRATFSNIEHQDIGFVKHTLTPWLKRVEQSIDSRLMTQQERSRYYAEFLVDGLLRGDTTTRYQAYAVGRSNGWLSANDIRRLENMNPVEGGDVYLVPLNMIPADQAAAGAFGGGERSLRELPAGTDKEQRAMRSANGRRRLQQAHLPLFRDVAGRVLRREANDVGNAMRRLLGQRDVPAFSAWLDEFYEGHEEFTARQWRPVLMAYAELVAAEAQQEVGGEVDQARLDGFINSYAAMLSARQAQRSRARLDELLAEFGAEAETEIERLLMDWRESRPDGVANEETVRSGGAVATFMYGALGVRTLRWMSFGKSCPYCTRLHGKVVGITDAFILAGTAFEGEGGVPPLVPTRNVGHPPSHKGCDCVVVAG